MESSQGGQPVPSQIVTNDVAGVIEFVRAGFGATGVVHADQPAVMRIGDATGRSPL
jgi:hypothetical protein